MSDNLNVVQVGTGKMSIEYTKVLNELVENFEVIGRGEKSANEFERETSKRPIVGGIKKYLENSTKKPTHAIVAVSVEELARVTMELLKNGVKNILVEKPAGLNLRELLELEIESKKQEANMFVGYNRRFYSSVDKARSIIEEDNGVSSFHFEFTEWSHIIKDLNKPKTVKEQWFFANSTHVVDLAFFLGGFPVNLSPLNSGEGNLDWHPIASTFVGSGSTNKGALFSYHSNWESAGRWGIEIMTKKRRLIFRPMEQLHVQNIGSNQVEKVDIDDSLDMDFKPGLYNQVKAFLYGDQKEKLLSISSHKKITEEVYSKMIFIQS
ncbi:Gfo/Idh/MocA family oxidoreductase [Chryseomicrobium palamuruense]|uniref:Gfo/Idh/MocA family oxidoreductase n=1 Tax=Chryseomicrobium palamuruense TaxID=682973 RepID=A0ABV8UW11_9BACL